MLEHFSEPFFVSLPLTCVTCFTVLPESDNHCLEHLEHLRRCTSHASHSWDAVEGVPKKEGQGWKNDNDDPEYFCLSQKSFLSGSLQ